MVDLDSYLAERGAWVGRELDRRLPRAETRPRVLHEAIRYALFTGGKRLRPILCLAAADAVLPLPAPAEREAALRAALAVEILHTYTLVHDDLPCMDDDDFRRGRPTVHKVYGEANAVLVGDALQAMAFGWLANTGSVAGPLAAELAAAAGSEGVIAGQVEDIAALGTTPSPDTVTYIHRHKTGDLFRAALRMGAIAVGAGSAQLDALTSCGNALGEAFQITDDLLDDPGLAGAATAPDRPPPLSCLAVMSRAEAQQRAQERLDDAVQALAAFPSDRRAPLEAIARRIATRTT